MPDNEKWFYTRAGLPLETSPQALRHSCATHLLAGGAVGALIGGAISYFGYKAFTNYNEDQKAKENALLPTPAGTQQQQHATAVAPPPPDSSGQNKQQQQQQPDKTSDKGAGLRRQIEGHEQKLAEYIKNPDAFDNQGLLKNVPTLEIRQRIIQGRINHLKTEIKAFEKALEKLNAN
ncbi:MAG: hypothetical protein HYR55_04000 [Acidobacteria bacterium]|nr:hypothetical protein [Acidobacteriota bacterium]MBI3658035.1 hypothetical protein [Acidobacteriota bacterium]